MDPNQQKVDTTLKGNESNPAQTVAEGKGKGKAVDLGPQDVSMGEDDSSSEDETGAEDEVCYLVIFKVSPQLIQELTHYDRRRKMKVN